MEFHVTVTAKMDVTGNAPDNFVLVLLFVSKPLLLPLIHLIVPHIRTIPACGTLQRMTVGGAKNLLVEIAMVDRFPNEIIVTYPSRCILLVRRAVEPERSTSSHVNTIDWCDKLTFQFNS